MNDPARTVGRTADPTASPSFDAAPVYRFLEESARRYPDAPALHFMGARLTYTALENRVARAARGLQELGVGPGVHVGLLLPNTPHYAIAFLAILRAGGTVVNYSPLDAERTLAHKIEDSRTDVLITLDLQDLYPRARGLLENSRLRHLVVGEVAEMAADAEAVRAALKAQGQLAEVDWDSRQRRFAALMDNAGDYRAYPIDDPAEEVAVLQYTGGTTGAPKGAVLTHGNLAGACKQMRACFQQELVPGGERVLAVLPPFHIYSMVVNLLFGLHLAAELYLHLRFDVEAVLRDIHEHRLSVIPAVPTMFIALIHHPDVARFDLTSLKMCNSGGAPLPLDVQQRFSALTGCRLGEGWGMTETASAGTYTPMSGDRPPLGSCGLVVPGVRMKIAPLDGEGTLDRNQRGEICVAGPNVTRAYWNNPEATRASMTDDGYFRTGDVGYLDENDYVFVVDRTKDMILCGGYNVYPRTIEEAVYEHDDVEEVSVIGVADAYRGQSPMAFVKLRDGAGPLTLEDLKAFLADKLGKHEMVQALEVREQLPKTPVGKLSKKELSDEMASFSL